ncbi:hypothetical protein K450DRAFT_246666 [Umbelopsis ramanniana AG]|uniref:F-box domain-containing protein n=1 Tax=Umbelopsis ramanniana AG TaxID=1314678 RepID=A0AAD5EAE7_UMBRA|nr:uncharacterized protein K450DRAFT_246666 [Umbelopsis ramanniana AG]KAI8578605.1 hypothetical protein K450DRAFT_246666 [Umbelopsis ramanniana AG]
MLSVSLPSPSPIIADPLTTSMLTPLLPSAFLCCPVEVRDAILSQLSQPSLLHLSATCRYFRQLILSRRQYWKSIKFDNSHERDVNANMILQFISALPANSRAATTDIEVGSLFVNTLPEIVVVLLQAFPNLVSLDARSLNCLDLLGPLASALAPLATTNMHQTRYQKFQRLLLVEKGESKVMPCEGNRTQHMARQLSSYLWALTSQGQHDIYVCEGCNEHLADIQYPSARCAACDEPIIGQSTCLYCSFACERCGDRFCGECDGRLTDSCVVCHDECPFFHQGFCTRCELERECASCHNKMCDEHTETCMCGALICSKELGCCSECR